MLPLISRFRADETGNATIDWMVLTAGIVLLGSAVIATLGASTNELADDTSVIVENREVGI